MFVFRILKCFFFKLNLLTISYIYSELLILFSILIKSIKNIIASLSPFHFFPPDPPSLPPSPSVFHSQVHSPFSSAFSNLSPVLVILFLPYRSPAFLLHPCLLSLFCDPLLLTRMFWVSETIHWSLVGCSTTESNDCPSPRIHQLPVVY